MLCLRVFWFFQVCAALRSSHVLLPSSGAGESGNDRTDDHFQGPFVAVAPSGTPAVSGRVGAPSVLPRRDVIVKAFDNAKDIVFHMDNEAMGSLELLRRRCEAIFVENAKPLPFLVLTSDACAKLVTPTSSQQSESLRLSDLIERKYSGPDQPSSPLPTPVEVVIVIIDLVLENLAATATVDDPHWPQRPPPPPPSWARAPRRAVPNTPMTITQEDSLSVELGNGSTRTVSASAMRSRIVQDVLLVRRCCATTLDVMSAGGSSRPDCGAADHVVAQCQSLRKHFAQSFGDFTSPATTNVILWDEVYGSYSELADTTRDHTSSLLQLIADLRNSFAAFFSDWNPDLKEHLTLTSSDEAGARGEHGEEQVRQALIQLGQHVNADSVAPMQDLLGAEDRYSCEDESSRELRKQRLEELKRRIKTCRVS